jgi:predicted transcriptional regulator
MVSKTRDILIVDKGGTFDAILKKFSSSSTKYDFDALSALRKVLSNEKARLIHTIKEKNPGSMYELSKMLGRDFKSVCEDIKLLQRFGMIDMVAEKTGKRKRLKPILVVDSLHINLVFT